MSDTAVRTHAMSVRSKAKRVLTIDISVVTVGALVEPFTLPVTEVAIACLHGGHRHRRPQAEGSPSLACGGCAACVVFDWTRRRPQSRASRRPRDQAEI